MNPITFNDKFEKFISAYPNSVVKDSLGKNWRTTPLFDYESTGEHENKLVEEYSNLDVFEFAPFSDFRLSLVSDWAPRGKYKANYIVRKFEDGFIYLVRIMELLDDTGPKDKLPPYGDLLFSSINIREPDRFDEHGVQVYKHILSMFYDGRWDIISGTYQRDQYRELAGPARAAETLAAFDAIVGAAHKMCQGALNSLGCFMIDSQLPTCHTAVVSPNRPGKSVEWVKARTHYTLITHGHPANRKEVQEGSEVKSSSEEEINRMAHNRRAHWRTYKHERYRFAKGKRKWIKQSWVGPKEWKDEGGKQIYRILEEVA